MLDARNNIRENGKTFVDMRWAEHGARDGNGKEGKELSIFVNKSEKLQACSSQRAKSQRPVFAGKETFESEVFHLQASSAQRCEVLQKVRTSLFITYLILEAQRPREWSAGVDTIMCRECSLPEVSQSAWYYTQAFVIKLRDQRLYNRDTVQHKILLRGSLPSLTVSGKAAGIYTW